MHFMQHPHSCQPRLLKRNNPYTKKIKPKIIRSSKTVPIHNNAIDNSFLYTKRKKKKKKSCNDVI